MRQTNTIRETLARCRAEGYAISEAALRGWVRTGAIPCVYAGNRALLLWDNVARFLRCEGAAQ